MGGVFSSIDVDKTLYSHADILDQLWAWCGRLENEIHMRTNQDNKTQNTGSGADVQSLSKKIDDVNAENGRLLADITTLSRKIDHNIADNSHWEADVRALPSKFHDILAAEINTINAKYKGLSLGLGIPLTIAVVLLCAMWIHRRYPYIPQHMSNEEAQNCIKIYNATRRKTLTEKVCDIF
ncbi:hypothetical protein N7447_009559 [Penicillium robsamsonii]|uniref:uncharacterized protein n=1 Tax=Penicillium robsamsonii TaxID=1792511 RepID=UPI0025478C63|nr:uncharacterized protein N7447_009559 [Penicillium robsamsonii]KAJ5817326.1 hypothetical protein N7447_009559 [Penicillium robsamsonii]